MMDDHIINNNNNIEMMIKQQYYSFDEEQAQQQQEQEDMIDLPPGFRFHPTDLELICHYLLPKLREVSFDPAAVAEVDLNKVEPWDLPKKAKMGEKEWYFFCVRDRKYPTGMRTNRATESGYWKATGKDKEIHRGKSLVGMKKTLVFYTGRAPKGHKSGWVMHEYRSEVGNGGGEQHSLSLSSSSSDHRNLPKISKNDWVLCRIFNKDWNAKRMQIIPEQMITSTTTTSYFTGGDVGDNLLHHQQQKNHFLPPLTESSPMTTGYHTCEDDVLSGLNPSSNVTCISDEEDEDSRKGITQYQQQQMTNPSLFNSGSFQYQTGELYTEDPFFGQDQSILRLLMDGNGGDSAAAMSLGRSTGGIEHSVDPTSTTTTSVYGGDYGSYHHHYQNNNNNSSSINHDYGPNIDVNCFLNY